MPRPNDPVVIDLAKHRRLRQLQQPTSTLQIPVLVKTIDAARADFCAASTDSDRTAIGARICSLMIDLDAAVDAAWQTMGTSPADLVAHARAVEFYCDLPAKAGSQEPEDRALAALVKSVLAANGDPHA